MPRPSSIDTRREFRLFVILSVANCEVSAIPWTPIVSVK